ncbi:MAG: glycosyltransferase [Desulfobulbaceae bacterium]|nr:glycosyltransferase [Desulfobulbaceae bacterium]
MDAPPPSHRPRADGIAAPGPDYQAGTAGLLLVSIVIPAYNAGQFLPQAIASVLAQSYPRVELLVLDDGSTDQTREILASYGAQFLWASHANMGQAATLNKGWDMAQGEILSYLSADDALKPGAVAAAVACLEGHPETVMAYGDYELIDVAGNRIRMVAAPEFDYAAMVADIVVQPGPGVFFRRPAYLRAGGWDPGLRQIPDYDFWLRLGAVGPFRRLPEVLAEYRVHGESQSFIEPTRQKAEECLVVMEKFFAREHLPAPVLPLKSRAFASAHLFCARLHLRAGRLAEVWRHLQRAWRWRPGSVLSPRAVKLLGNGLLFRFWRRFGVVR